MAALGASACPNPLKRKYRGCSDIHDYDMMGKLGEGTFGEVWKAKSRRTGSVFALKKFLMHNEKDGFPITALREINLLKSISHVNALKLTEMAIERPAGGTQRKRAVLYMVTPYMEHDLSGLLDNPAVSFTEPQMKCYMLQLLQGLNYLHQNHILHRDMKAANLLINNRGILQIADFGLARYYDEPVPQRGKGSGEAKRDYTHMVVTRWYRPPELLLGLRKYTPAVDMWGAGCVFGEMFKRKPILAGNTDLNQSSIIYDLVGSPNDDSMPGWSQLENAGLVRSWPARTGNLEQVFREQGSSAISLLRDMLKLDWRKRITAIDALEHPYFQQDPKAARPEEIPFFPDSHELDRRHSRGHQAALPPAPQGGTVGMGPNGECTSSDPTKNWDKPDRPPRGGGRGWEGERGPRRHGLDHGPPPRRDHYDSPRHSRPASRLPPPPPEGSRHPLPPPPHRRPDRDGGRDRGQGANFDSYVPSYGHDGVPSYGHDGPRHSRERDLDEPLPPPREREYRERERVDYGGGYDGYDDRDRDRRHHRDYRDPDAPQQDRRWPRDMRRTRSRSPGAHRDTRRRDERDAYWR